jgi:hypothetical protein
MVLIPNILYGFLEFDIYWWIQDTRVSSIVYFTILVLPVLIYYCELFIISEKFNIAYIVNRTYKNVIFDRRSPSLTDF